jgi:hypothetical protein
MITKWKNVPGTYSFELVFDGKIRDWDGNAPFVFQKIKPYFKENYGELIIHFLCSGYEDSGSMYGGPDNLGWPPESDEERILEKATFNGIELPKELAEELFNEYETEIEKTEVDYSSNEDTRW